LPLCGPLFFGYSELIALFPPEPPKMKCDQCEETAVVHVALTEHRKYSESAHLCRNHSGEYLPFDHIPILGAPCRRDDEVLADVRMLVKYDKPNQAIVYLGEQGGERCFYVVIGGCEGEAIARGLKSQPTPRPLTYDSMCNLIAALGCELREVAINRIDEFVFFSSIRIVQDGRVVEIDIRPSDAINLAIRRNAPIYINEHVLEQAALPRDVKKRLAL
jgi:uncharacterized protein